MPIYFAQLRDALDAEIALKGDVAQVDVIKWLSMTTMDIIGLAGFNYEFNSFDQTGEPSQLAEAFNQIFKPEPKVTLLMILRQLFPVLYLMVSTSTPGDHWRSCEAYSFVNSRIPILGGQLALRRSCAILA